ncbi:MAG: iron-sulfur cluster assembly scaffold protein [Verrucomicrobiales bacterium]|nr:iron-sulfur cluster assembly scaffold protein [Verrucomicrobiales bacterium]
MNTEDKIQDAIANPQNMGEMTDADSVGTVGNPECGDMVRMWLKFSEKDGKKVIDRASFQSFGCQTAIAVASMATEMLKGKSVEEAEALESTDLSEPLGPLPPMKLHCGEMVEGALRAALKGDSEDCPEPAEASAASSNTLLGDMNAPAMKSGRLKVVKLDE